MIRPTTPRDFPSLQALADATGFFKPGELIALAEVFRDFAVESQRANHQCVTFEESGRCLGFAYFAPSSMADRAWYLYWIAVDRSVQGRGIGRALMTHVEARLRETLDARLFLIETSSQSHYEPTRRFYLGRGFTIASSVADFYADGDDLVIFAKRLVPKAAGSHVPADPSSLAGFTNQGSEPSPRDDPRRAELDLPIALPGE